MLKPKLPDFDLAAYRQQPFWTRLQWACQSWAADGYGTPLAVHAVYGAKILAYMGIWLALCTLQPGQDLANIDAWWAGRSAFLTAVLWTMLFEGLGFGCGSGPLTARYLPPVGPLLYFLRPGTLKRPVFPGAPVIGAATRGLLDTGIYAAILGVLAAGLLIPESVSLWWLVPLVLAAGVLDRTLFLVFRSEHYLSVVILLLLSTDWVGGSRWAWLAIWFWAAASKLTPHFPAVMCVMTSNAPWTRFTPLRRWVYRDAPHDLRPSRFAVVFAHFGTLAEFAIPIGLAIAVSGFPQLAAPLLVLAVGFHMFILSNVPMAVPLEWNVMMSYGACVLFGAHVDVPLLAGATPWMWAWVALFHVALPAYGFQVPSRVSFLLSMRYYAGNWPWGVWLFTPSALDKLERSVTKWSPRVDHQLLRFYDQDTVDALLCKVPAFRAMHLHGRALQTLLPKAVDDVERYTWLDGEVVGGLVLGWNFGDGHLHREPLLHSLQSLCQFEPGELRCIFVESQPFFGRTLDYRIWDAATGKLDGGAIEVAGLHQLQPWRVEAPSSATRDA